MLIRKIFLLAFILSCCLYTGTGRPNDSLTQTNLQKQSLELLKKSHDFILTDKDKAFEFANQALLLSSSIEDQKDLVKALIQQGIYYSTTKKYTNSIDCFYNALTIANRNNFQVEKLEILQHIVYLYTELKKYDRAIELIEQAQELANKLSDVNQLAYLFIDRGRIYYETGKFDLAFRDYFYILSYADSITDSRAIMNIYRGLGTVYYYKKNDPWALYYFRLAVREGLKEELFSDLGSVYTLIAHIYQEQKNFDSCLKYNMLALDVRNKIHLTDHIASSKVNIGNLFLEYGKLEDAARWISEGIDLMHRSKDYNLIAYAFKQLSRLYLEQKDYPAAIEAIESFYTTEDSLIFSRNRGEVEQIEARYWMTEIKTEKDLLLKEIEIQQLQIRNKSYSEVILQLVLILVFLIIIFFFYLYSKSNRARERLQGINSQLAREVQERRRTEVQLHESKEKYRFIAESTMDLIVHLDKNFNYLFISPSINRMFGYSEEFRENLPSVVDLIPENFRKEMRSQYLEMVRAKEPVILTHQSKRKDGSLFWSESLVNPIFDEKTGKLKETITVTRDITDRIAYEESLSDNARQKETLLREIHHRVKNNFAILVGLMNMQKVSSHPGDYRDFLTELQGRIRTMSLVHELLYRSHDIDYIRSEEYLGQLISIISRAYNSDSVRIHTSLEPCILDVETALPLGLICNELITNSFKYGLADHPEGELWIDLHRCPDAADPGGMYTHILTIRDNGPGLPEDYSFENRKSMGSQIISLLIDQLEGRLEFSKGPGASFTIYFSDEKRS